MLLCVGGRRGLYLNTLCVFGLGRAICDWNTLGGHDGICRFWEASLVSISHEVDLSNLHRCDATLCNVCVPLVVFFNGGAQIVRIAPYLARLVLLEVLIKLVVRRHQHLLCRLLLFGSPCILSRLASGCCAESRPRLDWQRRHRGRLAKHHSTTPVLIECRPQLHVLRRRPCPFLRFQDSLHLTGVWLHATSLQKSALRLGVLLDVLNERLHVRGPLSFSEIPVALERAALIEGAHAAAAAIISIAVKNVDQTFADVALEHLEIPHACRLRVSE